MVLTFQKLDSGLPCQLLAGEAAGLPVLVFMASVFLALLP